MPTERIFVIWVALELRVRFRASKTGLSAPPPPTPIPPLHQVAFLLTVPRQFLFCSLFLSLCASVVSYGVFVLFLFVPHLITKTRLFKYIENFTAKNWKFSDKKNSDIFHISAQNIDCGNSLEPPRRGGSNEYPQSMFLSRHKKNNIYHCKPQFYHRKVGFKGFKII